MLYICPKSPCPQELLHHVGVFSRDSFVIVVDDEAIATTDVLQEAFESRDKLLEGLFIDFLTGSFGIEMYLVDALRKKASMSPNSRCTLLIL